MAKLPRSPIAQDVSNNYRPVQEARASSADPVGAALEGAGNAGFEIASRMADAKIAADAAEASIRLRSRLDEEYRAIENDMEGDPSGFEARFRERAAAVANEEAERMSSPAMKRAFAMKSMEMTETFGISMRDVTRRRQVEGVKAQTLKVGADYEALAKDPAKPRELLDAARDDYLSLIDQQVKAGIYTPDVAEAARIAAREVYQTGVTTRHLTNMDALLDAGRAGEAEEYFKANYGEISPAEREKAEAVLETKGLEARAITKADEFWAKSGGDYGAALNDAYGIQNPEERLAVEARLAQLKNQFDAAVAASDQAHLEKGMDYVTRGEAIPADLLRQASPLVRDRLQTEVRTRQQWAQQMATLSAQEKAALREVSKGNYYTLKAQLADPELAAGGLNAILSDPNLAAMYETLGPDERGQLFNEIANAATPGTADKTMKAYKSVVSLASAYMPESLTPEKYATQFGGLGEGDPGVAFISANRSKAPGAMAFERELMRLVDAETARLGGAEITTDRAKQLVAQAYAAAGKKEDGTTKYPIPQDVAGGIVGTDIRRVTMDYRTRNPAIWREATTLVRSQYPNASDELILEEARRIEQQLAMMRAGKGERGRFPME